MADVQYAPHTGAEQGRPSGGGNALTVAGAAVSLAFMVGIGIWGYKLMARDVSGVPVVRAIEGPMRVQPDDPGGLPADHQGLAVNAVAARGEAAPTPDQLLLAPRPVDLTDEDRPMQTLAAVARVEPVAGTAAAAGAGATEEPESKGALAALVDELTQGVKPFEDSDSDGGDVIAALTPEDDWAGVTEQAPAADTPDADLPPDVDVETIDDPEAGIDEVAKVVPVVIDAPGVRKSPRPLARPAGLRRPVDTAVVAAAAPASAVVDVDPSTLAAGTRLAQLGAYDSPEVAREEWEKLAVRFSDYIEGKQRVVQQSSSGGRTFYRLRAKGFDDLSDARRFCSALVAEGADCIPVVTR